MLRGLIFASLALFAASAAGAEPTGRSDPEALPDLRIARGERDIAAAWLIAPTTRYRHFVLGSQYEAGGLRVRLATGQVLTHMLDDQHVFEDRQPRLADLDGDGHDEIVLVLSRVREGAALAVYEVAAGTIRLKAQTAHIGQANRWLNPAGIADFDGDGAPDVAVVAMPHLVKRLDVWTLSGRALRRIATLDDVSNHRLGSAHTGMAAVGDFDGDGIADLAVPDGSRRQLRLISFAGAQPVEIGRAPLSGPADGAFSANPAGGGWRFVVPLETGQSDTVTWRAP